MGVLRESGTLYPYHTKALARGSVHHDPALEALHHPGAELLQPGHFCGDVVVTCLLSSDLKIFGDGSVEVGC
jgi:uncharacterized protein YijF (DUF1287 family)